MYPESIERLATSLKRFPGIGEKTAERIIYHLIHQEKQTAMELADAIKTVKDKILICSQCCNITETDPCKICSNQKRDRSLLCTVEQPKDLWAIEKTGIYKGLYHVLHGAISPLDGILEGDLTINKLIKRLSENNFAEIIIATNPTIEGEATAVYISEKLKSTGIDFKITRIAKGVPHGYTLEYMNPETIKSAIESRKVLV